MSLLREKISLRFGERRGWITPARFMGIVFLVGVVWLVFLFLRMPKQTWVDGLLESWYMSKGLLIYKDFTSQYTPLLYLIMWVFHKIWGFGQEPTIWLSLVSSVMVFVTLAFVSTKWLTGWYRVLPLLFFLVWEPIVGGNHYGTMAFHEMVDLLALVMWFEWYRRGGKVAALFLGFFLGAGLMSTQIVGGFVIVIFISLVFRWWQKRGKWLTWPWAIVGFLIPVITVVGWLVGKGLISWFYYWAVKYYFYGYAYSLGRGWDNILIYFSIFLPLLFVVAAAMLWFFCKEARVQWRKKDVELSQLGWFFFILLSLPLPFWFAIFHPNRFQMGLAIFALIFGWGFELLMMVRRRRWLSWGLMGLILCCNLVGVYRVVIPKLTWGWNYALEKNVLTRIYSDDPMYQVEEWVRRNTRSDDKLMATTDSMIYLDTDRLPVSRRVTTNLPQAYYPLEEFAKELSINPPDYWIIDERNWQRFRDFGKGDAAEMLIGILNCEPLVVKFDYVTIRKHEVGKPLCISDVD